MAMGIFVAKLQSRFHHRDTEDTENFVRAAIE
jgi:hypothetical protein